MTADMQVSTFIRLWMPPAGLKAWSEATRSRNGGARRAREHRQPDFRLGGMFHYAMAFQPGQEMYGRFVYREIVSPSARAHNCFPMRLARARAVSQLKGERPLEVLHVMRLTELGGTTTPRAQRSTPPRRNRTSSPGMSSRCARAMAEPSTSSPPIWRGPRNRQRLQRVKEKSAAAKIFLRSCVDPPRSRSSSHR